MTALNADLLKLSFSKASRHLEKNHRILNNLNVFPVPDGDTGSNMSSSLKAAVSCLEDQNPGTLTDLARIFCEELNSHSRGNSGFILARFFAGFFSTREEQELISSKGLGERFSRGAFLVNTSLFSPTEGTMISIIAAMTDYFRSVSATDIRDLIRGALECGRKALEKTPLELPLLARAGVIDSGALGFIVLFEGFLSGLTGVEPREEREEDYRFKPDKTIRTGSDFRISYRYCTEILVNPSRDIPPEDLSQFLKKRGNSIALVNEAELVKLHIHTNDPEEIIRYLSEYGVLEKTKIEDMQDQADLFIKESESTDNAVLVCTPGDGFIEIFKNLGADYSLSYDEKLPSAREITEALEEIDNEHIIIITNNRNIIPAAIMARDESTKSVSILPTDNVAKGIAAMYGFSENDRIADNARNMNECLDLVRSFSLFESAMDSLFGDISIPRGSFFALHSGEILSAGPDRDSVLRESFSSFSLDEIGNITLFTGRRCEPSSLEGIISFLRTQNEGLEIEVLYGGQTREELIVSLE